MNSPTIKTQSTKPKLYIVIILVVALVTLGVWGWMTFYANPNTLQTNRAEETMKPLQVALEKANGVLKNASGNSGKTSDNTEPYYDVIYDLPLNKDDTIALMNKIAQENGYKLTHATTKDRGNLSSVADIYIDAWYFDITSKTSTFSDLEQGPVYLDAKVGDDQNQPVQGHTLLRFSVRLPSIKQ